MSRYISTTLLWSPSAMRYIQPGEEIEVSGEGEIILLEAGMIRPAEVTQPHRVEKSKKKELEG